MTIDPRQTPETEIPVQPPIKGKALFFSKRRRNAKRIALFFTGARVGRDSVGRFNAWNRS